MADTRRRGLSERVRHSQNLLLFGGGVVVSLVVIVAFVVDSMTTVHVWLDQFRHDWTLDARRVVEDNASYGVYFRNNLLNLQNAWNSGSTANPSTLDALKTSNGLLVLRANATARPVLVVQPDARSPSPLTGRYVGLAERSAGPVTIARPEIAGITNYFISADRDIALLSVSRWPASRPVEPDLGGRENLMRAFAFDGDAPLISPEARAAGASSAGSGVRWLRPFADPLTGERVVRAATSVRDAQQEVIGVMVGEIPVSRLLASVPIAHYGGRFFIAAPDGEIIASTSLRRRAPTAAETALLARAVHADPDGDDASLMDGMYVLQEKYGDTGWRIVYVEPWRQLAKTVAPQLVVSALTMLCILAALWIVLLLFNRRVFRPVYEQSQRVFDSEQLSRTLIEMAPVGLGLIAREDARPLLSSPMMEAMAGRAQLGGATLPEELVRAHGGGASHVELSVDTADGQPVDLSVNMAPARYQGRAVLVTAFTDVTARKQLERQLREARQAADAANAAKSTFLATMSHEIRTPLNAMLGNLELLGHTDLNARQQDRLATIRQSSQGLLSVISDVLDFSKIEAGEMTLERIEFGLAEVLERTLAMFAPVARAKGLALYAVMWCAPGQTVRGDPTRLAQIVNNLMGNAIKFTQFGKVTLETELVDGELVVSVADTGIGLTPAQQAGLFQAFAQADSTISRRFGGTGLGLALCQRLAEAMGGTIGAESQYGAGSRFTLRFPAGQTAVAPVRLFAQERRPVIFVSREAEWREAVVPHLRGWGLDVRVMKSAAEVDAALLQQACGVVLYGEGATGDEAQAENHLVEAGLWVIMGSAEGPWEPARFGRLIDVTAYSVSALERALRMALLGEGSKRGVQAGTHAVSRKLAVLVAEDNAVNRQLFEEQLALLGCEARVVSGGAEALEALESQHWDVVLTDLNMPGMSGYELVARIRARDVSIPVVAVTAQATLEERQRCEAAGMTRMVTKPLSLASLREMLEQVSSGDASDAYDDETTDDLLGGHALPAHLLETFREASEASLAVIAQAHATSEAAPLLAELHTLKGMLGVFRARELAHYCAHLEQQIATQGIEAVTPADLAALATEVRKLASSPADEASGHSTRNSD